MPHHRATRRTVLFASLAALAGCAAPAASPLSAQDQSDIARIQTALDQLHGLRSRFQQTDERGGVSSGTVWYDPGRLRLAYDPPVSMLVVATGKHLVAHRNSDGATTRIALSANPLGLLLAQPLRLSGAISVTNVQRGPGVLQASLARTANPAQGLLTLIFADQPAGLALSGLQAVDQRRQHTDFHLFAVQTGLALDPALFVPPDG